MTRPKILVGCGSCGFLFAAGRIYRNRWAPEKHVCCPACDQEDELSTWAPYIWDEEYKGYREPTSKEFLEDFLGIAEDEQI